MSDISEVVNEIIREDGAADTLEDVVKEIHGVMVVNELLNHALKHQMERVAAMQKRIDRMIVIANQMEAEQTSYVWQIIEYLTRGGTHRDKDESTLQAIGKIRNMVKGLSWDIQRLTNAEPLDDYSPEQDVDDIPF